MYPYRYMLVTNVRRVGIKKPNYFFTDPFWEEKP